MAFGDLVRNREIGSSTIIKGNIDRNVSVIPILQKKLTFVKFSGGNSSREVDVNNCIANALWEMI